MEHSHTDSCKDLSPAVHAKLERVWDRMEHVQDLKSRFWDEYARLRELEKQVDTQINLYTQAIQHLISLGQAEAKNK